MLFKIGNKYYVKMRNYYKELDIQNDNIVPSKNEDAIITDMSVPATPMSYEEVIADSLNKKENVVYRKRKEK